MGGNSRKVSHPHDHKHSRGYTRKTVDSDKNVVPKVTPGTQSKKKKKPNMSDTIA